MGRFSTTVHIKNNVDRMRFVNTFSNVMKKRGFVPCSEDEAAQSYLFAFGEGWVTLANEEYKDNPQKAYDDTREMAKAFKTSAFSVEVVDSDFAIMTLLATDGAEDRVVVGDGSGYGVDTAEGDRKLWMSLLADGKTWEQFSEAAAAQEVFAGDALGKVAEILGIDPYYIDAEYDEVSEKADGDNVTTFYFKKTAAKAMSLNAAFVKVFGEGLEPLGFKRLKKIKNKHPYFVRIVSGEMLQIVTFRQVSTPKTGYKNIEILGGIASLYRRNLDFIYFTNNPQDWLNTNGRFLDLVPFFDQSVMERTIQFTCDIWGTDRNRIIQDEGLNEAFRYRIHSFLCKTDDILLGIQLAFEITKNVMLAFLNQVTTLNSCVDYFYETNQRMDLCPFDEFIVNDFYSRSEGLILIKMGYRDDGVDRLRKNADIASRSLGCQSTPENVEKAFNKYIQQHESYRAEQVALRNKMLDDPELNKRVLDEMERCKVNNIEVLKSYGILID